MPAALYRVYQIQERRPAFLRGSCSWHAFLYFVSGFSESDIRQSFWKSEVFGKVKALKKGALKRVRLFRPHYLKDSFRVVSEIASSASILQHYAL